MISTCLLCGNTKLHIPNISCHGKELFKKTLIIKKFEEDRSEPLHQACLKQKNLDQCLWQGSCAQDLVAYFCALFPLTVCLIPLTVITTYLQHRRCCRHRDSCTGLYNHNKHYHCSATMILMCKLHCISIN